MDLNFFVSYQLCQSVIFHSLEYDVVKISDDCESEKVFDDIKHSRGLNHQELVCNLEHQHCKYLE